MNIKAMVWLGILLAVLFIAFLIYSWFLETIIFLTAACAGEAVTLIAAQKLGDKKKN